VLLQRLHWPVFILVGACLLAAVWIVTQPVGPQAFALPDGRVLTIKGATFGLRHCYIHGQLWQRVLGRCLPEKWAKRLGAQILTQYSDRPTLMVWLQRREVSAPVPPIAEASLLDDQGHEIAPLYRKLEAAPQPFLTILGWEFEHFPRRARNLRVRFYSRDNDARLRQVAEFVLSNPARRSYPQWQTAPLPITRTQDDLDFTLLDLKTGPPVLPAAKTNRNAVFEPVVTAAFRVAKAGQVLTDWCVSALDFSDATGNHFVVKPPACASSGDQFLVTARATFWPSESAWKLNAEFFRRANFTADELFMLPNVQVPAPGQQTVINQAFAIQGFVLRVVHLGSDAQPDRSRPWLPQWNADLAAEFETGTASARLALVNAQDQLQRDLRHEWSYQTPNGQQHFRLEVPANATSLDLRFAVQQTRWLEYLVPPP
jgi:hypothetical protein